MRTVSKQWQTRLHHALGANSVGRQCRLDNTKIGSHGSLPGIVQNRSVIHEYIKTPELTGLRQLALDGLHDAPRSGLPHTVTPAIEALFSTFLQHDPQWIALTFLLTCWTMAMLIMSAKRWLPSFRRRHPSKPDIGPLRKCDRNFLTSI